MSWFEDHVADVIESNERHWAQKCINENLLPVPNEKQTIQLCELGIIIGDKYKDESRLCHAICQHSKKSQDHRNFCVITDQFKEVVSVFVKLGGYDLVADLFILMFLSVDMRRLLYEYSNFHDLLQIRACSKYTKKECSSFVAKTFSCTNARHATPQILQWLLTELIPKITFPSKNWQDFVISAILWDKTDFVLHVPLSMIPFDMIWKAKGMLNPNNHRMLQYLVEHSSVQDQDTIQQYTLQNNIPFLLDYSGPILFLNTNVQYNWRMVHELTFLFDRTIWQQLDDLQDMKTQLYCAYRGSIFVRIVTAFVICALNWLFSSKSLLSYASHIGSLCLPSIITYGAPQKAFRHPKCEFILFIGIFPVLCYYYWQFVIWMTWDILKTTAILRTNTMLMHIIVRFVFIFSFLGFDYFLWMQL